jgi:predicted nuclease of predicted toxin-antitoxin system
MKLLFDENLSPRLVERLREAFPDGAHVSQLGLAAASDAAVWEYARAHDYVLVSKDADFSELSLLRGFPPKVIWLQIGNCTTNQIEALLRTHEQVMCSFNSDDSVGVLILS